MSKAMYTAICAECSNPTKIPFIPDGTRPVYCPDCLNRKKQQNIEELAKTIKQDYNEYSEDIEFDLSDPRQKLAAVRIQGELFATKPGGLQLMTTEFVENSIDAVKKKKTLQALPKAINQSGLSPELSNIAIQKYQFPQKEFEKNILESLSNEDKQKLEMLDDKIHKIIKSDFNEVQDIIIEIDQKNRQLKIIDPGTGIEYPRHICAKPFISLKTREDYSTGQFGRGAQVFRAFANTMEFISLRKSMSKEEQEHLEKQGYDYSKIDNGVCIKLVFPEDEAKGNYNLITKNDFRKLSNYESGTVVIIKNWREDYFEELTKKIPRLERRLQHHFGFEISKGIYNIRLILRTPKEIIITSKDYENEPKIQGKFDINSIMLKDQNGKSIGTIEFNLYKTSRSYNDDFKKPYLIVRGRPLGDSFISEIPEMETYSEVWSSNFITGYVVCDSLKPNQLRTGLDSTPSKKIFLTQMLSASIDLKRLLGEWKQELDTGIDQEMGNQVASLVNKFFVRKGLKFNFKNPIQKGLHDKLNQSGNTLDIERISNIPDGKNQGILMKEGTETVDIMYDSEKRGPHGPIRNPDQEIEVTISTPKKDGRKKRTVYIKRSVLSKGGRKIQRSLSGPGIKFDPNDGEEMELSFYEADPPTVMINSEHPAWKKLRKKSIEQQNESKFHALKEKYMMERYMWEILNNCLENSKEIDKEQITNMFWTYFHELTDTK